MTLTATGDAIAYHWDLGDKTQADGPVVQHQYGTGRFTATVTGTAADGSTAQASVVITSAQLTLSGPKVATYGKRATFRGRMAPALRGAPITLYAGATPVKTVKADKKGRFSFRIEQTGARVVRGALRRGRIERRGRARAARPGRRRAAQRNGRPRAQAAREAPAERLRDA